MRSQSTDSPTVVADFVYKTCVLLGATVEEVDWGVYDVLWPEGELQRITFDVEIAQERPDCELVTLGTPLFEHIQRASRQSGRLQVHRLLISIDTVPRLMDEKVRKLVHFVKCRAPQVTSWTAQEGCAVLYRFHVTYQMADIVEEILSVLIDVGSLAEITPLLPSLESQWVNTKMTNAATNAEGSAHGEHGVNDNTLPLRDMHTLLDSYRQAVKVASKRINQRMSELKSEYQSQRQEELAQSQQYYQTTLDTLQQQLHATTDPTRAERLQGKIQATTADWDHRREDIARAYDLSADVSLDQSILYIAPVLRIGVHAQHRTEQLPFVLDYYPWAKTWAPVICPACYETSEQLQYDQSGWHCGCLL